MLFGGVCMMEREVRGWWVWVWDWEVERNGFWMWDVEVWVRVWGERGLNCWRVFRLVEVFV